MLNNLINNIKNKINTIKEENENYNKLPNNSSKFTNLKPLPNLNNKIIEGKINYITKTCPDINKDKNIVFHSNTFNYKYNYQEITNYELLLDNSPIISKNSITTKHINSMQNSCYSISIKITTYNNIFTIPILEPNSINIKYTYQNSIFQSNINFAKEIINKLNELYKSNY